MAITPECRARVQFRVGAITSTPSKPSALMRAKSASHLPVSAASSTPHSVFATFRVGMAAARAARRSGGRLCGGLPRGERGARYVVVSSDGSQERFTLGSRQPSSQKFYSYAHRVSSQIFEENPALVPQSAARWMAEASPTWLQ